MGFRGHIFAIALYLSICEGLQIDYDGLNFPSTPTTTWKYDDKELNNTNSLENSHLSFGPESRIYVRRDGTINLTCSIVSANPREEVTWYHNGTLVAPDQTQWVSNNRICTSKGRTNCSIETSFNLVIEGANLENSGTYRCAAKSAEPAEVFVEVIGEPIIDGSYWGYSQRRIFDISARALELYGVNEAAVDDIIEQCSAYTETQCNVILGAHSFKYRVQKQSYLEFQLGSVHLVVYLSR